MKKILPHTSSGRLIVGAGRVSRHLQRYLSLLQIPFTVWSRAQGRAPRFENYAQVFLLIKDDALEAFVKAHPSVLQTQAIHFSASVSVPGVIRCHPLVSFGDALYPLEFYERIPFVIEKEGPPFDAIFPQFNNPAMVLEARSFALYHSLLVMAGNFSAILLRKAKSEFEALGLPAAALIPYVESLTRQSLAYLNQEIADPVTGPFARKDRGTMDKNVEALGHDPYAKIYEAFRSLSEESHL